MLEICHLTLSIDVFIITKLTISKCKVFSNTEVFILILYRFQKL